MKFGAVFLMLLTLGALNAAVAPRGKVPPEPASRRVAVNTRLTALNGAWLFVLLVAVAISVLFIRPFLPVHYLVGIALIPPLILKLSTTGYRFVKYYLGDPDYRGAGTPPPFLRYVVAPALVISTVVVMGTGLELWAFGARFGSAWVSLHTASAVAFMLALFLHLVSHARKSATAALEDAAREPAADAITRRSVLLACAILSCVLAVASLAYVTPFGASGGGG